MSITDYQQLKSRDSAELGVALPNLTPSGLSTICEVVDADELLKRLSTISLTNGWATYNDQVVIATQLNSLQGLLEAEYTNGTQSFHIRLLNTDEFQLTHFQPDENALDADFAYKHQSIVIRGNLQNHHKFAQYRIWYQSINARWTPFAQQFMGFSSTTSEEV
ncbi:hypothetical protein AB4524_00790 [Vibrio breoganii]